jgi:aspartyl-tRNA(Asn)/glutamyl-tRNA(Gln) amidotransferase subunit B
LNYEAVIGLEVHAELATQSKMFCGCAVVDSTQAAPNTCVCPVCAGLPGSLPVINGRAVEYALRVALALNCSIPPLNVFARKNYFYPDQPKGYQISQYEQPLGVNGWIELETAAGPRRVRIRRVHLEEDTGKLFHSAEPGSAAGQHSLVDLNRAGVPLLEIVTEPDLHTPEDVRAYGVQLRAVLRYLGVNSGDMEKGVIRFEPNISVRPAGSGELRTRTELKNLNSFRALERGTQYEIERQAQLWDSGGQVRQETLGWNEAEGRTVPQRGKEHAHDYRYFPEPDLPPLVMDPAWVARVRAELPELPAARRARFVADYGLSRYDAELLVEELAVADYFERAVAAQPDGRRSPKALANWITGELFRLMNQAGQSIGQVSTTPAQMAELVDLVAGGALNLNTAKTVFEAMVRTGRPAGVIVAEQGLGQVSDTSEIAAVVAEVIAANPGELATYLAGKDSVEEWFFGQVMRRLRGRGNPQVIRQTLSAALEESKQKE